MSHISNYRFKLKLFHEILSVFAHCLCFVAVLLIFVSKFVLFFITCVSKCRKIARMNQIVQREQQKYYVKFICYVCTLFIIIIFMMIIIILCTLNRCAKSLFEITVNFVIRRHDTFELLHR